VREALWVLYGSGHTTGLTENLMAVFNGRWEVGVLFVKALCARTDIILFNEPAVHSGGDISTNWLLFRVTSCIMNL
jgi:hypothetical protein